MPPMIPKRLAARLLHRTVRFLFVVLVALLALFVLGNIQNFLDATQVMILKFIVASGTLLFTCALFAFLFELYYIIHTRGFLYFHYCIMSLASALIGLIVALAASAILLLSGGSHPS